MHTWLNLGAMHTADGEVSADKGIITWPFREIRDVDVGCYILPNSPSPQSLGRLFPGANFDFSWSRGEKPWLTFPDGESDHLEVSSREPAWPMPRDQRCLSAGMVCHSTRGGSSGSWEAPGGPVSTEHMEGVESAAGEEEEEVVLEMGFAPSPLHHASAEDGRV